MILALRCSCQRRLLVRGRAQLSRRRAVLNDPGLLRVQTLLQITPCRIRIAVILQLRLLGHVAAAIHSYIVI